MIYFLQRADGAIKIGTTEQYYTRIYQLIREYGDLDLLGLMDGGREIERQVHERFSHVRVKRTEWFMQSTDLLDYIRFNTHLQLPPVPEKVIQVKSRKTPTTPGRVRNRLIELISKKQQVENRLIKIRELAQETGISHQTIYSWMDDNLTRFEVKVCDAFCRYFDCNYGDLLYLDRTPEAQ